MANWVCKQDSVLFPPGMPCCPQCQTRDAFEQGGDQSLNVYDAVEVTGIASPGAAWAVVCEAAAVAVHEHQQAWDVTVSAEEARAVLMAGDAEVAERLGMVPGDSGAADSSTDPEPIPYAGDPKEAAELQVVGTEVREESGMSAGGESGDAVAGGETGDDASAGDTPGTGKTKSTSKARQKDVLS